MALSEGNPNMNHVIPAKAGTHSNSGIWLGTEMDPRLRGDDKPLK